MCNWLNLYVIVYCRSSKNLQKYYLKVEHYKIIRGSLLSTVNKKVIQALLPARAVYNCDIVDVEEIFID